MWCSVRVVCVSTLARVCECVQYGALRGHRSRSLLPNRPNGQVVFAMQVSLARGQRNMLLAHPAHLSLFASRLCGVSGLASRACARTRYAAFCFCCVSWFLVFPVLVCTCKNTTTPLCHAPVHPRACTTPLFSYPLCLCSRFPFPRPPCGLTRPPVTWYPHSPSRLRTHAQTPVLPRTVVRHTHAVASFPYFFSYCELAWSTCSQCQKNASVHVSHVPVCMFACACMCLPLCVHVFFLCACGDGADAPLPRSFPHSGRKTFMCVCV